ncbi:hybrid sensor histidine kinase/response regulator [Parvibaculum sp.]|jgi:signal transduction histidine kinase|uniref:hybrid sensor histidine kinase/response regulator n=1 Tax=Parvibaculum sp. TaxID=2024848 RepID=UPI000C5AE056|nr:hybrid sensor histidine kinase/response regulator [Parvibaculum sp.]MAM95207.1 hybrid sensor histidine kinase/response regulator [Parvibaculum sp.]|tara:strand:+ start:19195 stop:20973 length:1779 start_codon:yes stop_codon:yes gene_type:complete
MLRERLHAFGSAEKWQLDYLFDLSFQAWLVHIGVVTATMALLVYAWPGETWPWVWYAAICSFSVALAVLAWHYTHDRPEDDAAARPYGVAHSVLTFFVGMSWGLGAFGAATGDFHYLLVYSLALGGTALAAVSSQHALPRSCFISLWTSVPLLGLAHLYHDPGLGGVAVMVMMLLYGGVLSILSFRLLRFMTANVMLTRSLDAKLGEITEMAAELEDARREAVEANLSKSRFLAHASHDLRQPVHAIGLFTACLRDLRLDPEARQHVASIDNAARSVSRLLGSLLDISRLDVGGIVPQPERISLDDVLRGIGRQNADALRESGGDLVVEPAGTWVSADPALLSTMIQNLISNALKYARGATVRIRVRLDGEHHAVLEISDDGPGIAEADLRHIFDEFYRAGNDAHHKEEGLGLGLAIVRRLGGLMGLDVGIDSAEGRGTTIRIAGLPVVEPGAISVPRAHRQHPLTGLAVCVIDDDPDVLAATATLLRRWGCEVMEFTSLPEEAVGCDAVVSDFDLGGSLDGFGIVARIREMEGWNVPAAILTGRSEPETLMHLARSGIPFLRKPAHPAELRALLTGFALGDEVQEDDAAIS